VLDGEIDALRERIAELLEQDAAKDDSMLVMEHRISELEAQLAELKSPPTSAVPEKRIDDSDYSTGWNDCRAWVIQSSYTAPPNRRE